MSKIANISFRDISKVGFAQIASSPKSLIFLLEFFRIRVKSYFVLEMGAVENFGRQISSDALINNLPPDY